MSHFDLLVAGLHTGTIPGKALREIAFLASRLARRGMREALTPEKPQDHAFLAEVVRKKDTLIAQLEAVTLNRLMRNGASLIPGEVFFIDARTPGVRRPGGQTPEFTADFDGTLDDLANNVFNFPTWSGGYKTAAFQCP